LVAQVIGGLTASCSRMMGALCCSVQAGGEARRRDKGTIGGAHVENVAPTIENISACI